MNLVTITDLAFRYPGSTRNDFHLRVPEFYIEEGTSVALTGMSGSGKTTLANLLSGILVTDSGTIYVNDRAVHTMRDHERRAFRIATIGYVFQDLGLLDYLTAAENIFLPFSINRSLQRNATHDTKAQAITDALGISDQLEAKPHQLSGGERQRVALARALVTRPRLVIADEPTGSLDPDTAAETVALIHKTVREADATLLTITHDSTVAESHDRVVTMEGLTW